MQNTLADDVREIVALWVNVRSLTKSPVTARDMQDDVTLHSFLDGVARENDKDEIALDLGDTLSSELDGKHHMITSIGGSATELGKALKECSVYAVTVGALIREVEKVKDRFPAVLH